MIATFVIMITEDHTSIARWAAMQVDCRHRQTCVASSGQFGPVRAVRGPPGLASWGLPNVRGQSGRLGLGGRWGRIQGLVGGSGECLCGGVGHGVRIVDLAPGGPGGGPVTLSQFLQSIHVVNDYHSRHE